MGESQYSKMPDDARRQLPRERVGQLKETLLDRMGGSFDNEADGIKFKGGESIATSPWVAFPGRCTHSACMRVSPRSGTNASAESRDFPLDFFAGSRWVRRGRVRI